MRVLSVLGGRPHLVKAESVHRAFVNAEGYEHLTVEYWHGNRSDYPNRGDQDFELPTPVHSLRPSSMPRIAEALGRVLAESRPDIVLVYGDLTVTTRATAMARAAGLRLVHIESGYRSGDPTDPEETARILVDHGVHHRIAFTRGMESNLLREGIDPTTISRFGDCALHTLHRRLERLVDESAAYVPTAGRGLVAFHHAENLRTAQRAAQMVEHIRRLASAFDIHFIAYGRTREILRGFDLERPLTDAGVTILDTLPYDGYVRELLEAAFVVTDSSGLQDECAFLQKPCFVLRAATPRQELLGKAIRLRPPHIEPMALLSAVSEAVGAHGSQGPDLSLLGRPYDGSFLEALSSLA